MENSVRLSKFLSKILRHKAEEYGFAIQSDGFVSVSELLAHRDFRRFTLEDIVHVVETNDKKRFELCTGAYKFCFRLKLTFLILLTYVVHGEMKIRAVQGHSLRNIDDTLLLTLITNPADLPVALHGTNINALSSIMATGLDRMSRNHIHLAVGTPEEGVISGMRKNVKVI